VDDKLAVADLDPIIVKVPVFVCTENPGHVVSDPFGPAYETSCDCLPETESQVEYNSQHEVCCSVCGKLAELCWDYSCPICSFGGDLVKAVRVEVPFEQKVLLQLLNHLEVKQVEPR